MPTFNGDSLSHQQQETHFSSLSNADEFETAHDCLVIIYHHCFVNCFLVRDPPVQTECNVFFFFNTKIRFFPQNVHLKTLNEEKNEFRMFHFFFIKHEILHLCISSFLQVWCNKSLYSSGWLVSGERQNAHHSSRWWNSLTSHSTRLSQIIFKKNQHLFFSLKYIQIRNTFMQLLQKH